MALTPKQSTRDVAVGTDPGFYGRSRYATAADGPREPHSLTVSVYGRDMNFDLAPGETVVMRVAIADNKMAEVQYMVHGADGRLVGGYPFDPADHFDPGTDLG